MKPYSAKLARLLAEAAEHRARGASWELVAAKVGRHPATCRRWPSLYPEVWRRHLQAAERQLLAEASAEAMAMMRQLLRSEDEKVRRDAACALVTLRQRQCEREGRAAGDDRDGLPDSPERLDDAELRTIAEELWPEADRPDAGASGGAAQPG
jgi:hypothetical protein